MIEERINNINYNIAQIEAILDDIFDSFNNFNFDNIPCTAYVYKNKIRFVPLIIKDKVDTLFVVHDKMNESKSNILTKKR